MRALLVIPLLLALAGCSDKSCKDACDKLKSCSLDSSGLSCDASCGSPDDACAACVNDTACADLESGKCASDCPQASFKKKP